VDGLDPVGLAIGVLIGAIVAWAITRSVGGSAREASARRIAELERDLAVSQQQLTAHAAASEAAEGRLREAFQSLAADALRQNSDQFITRAAETLDGIRKQGAGDLDLRRQAIDGVVSPIREHLERVAARVEELDRARVETFGALQQHIETVNRGQLEVANQTRGLVQALRAPQTRGRWGELNLKRVVELAGMTEHVDFVQQASVTTEDGRIRPDLVVQLPGSRDIVVDAKTPLDAYLRAVEAADADARAAALKQHAQQLRTHVSQLAGKAYWEQFDAAPDFVIMFVPGEAFLSSACLEDPTLLEEALDKKVILASPTLLVALLRTIALGWRQEKLAEHAARISETAMELLDRLATMATHFANIGGRLDGAVKAYNDTVSSLESRVLVTARRIRELGVGGKREIGEMERVEGSVRAISAPELTEG
jgi:DNA recombination protein RmuC